MRITTLCVFLFTLMGTPVHAQESVPAQAEYPAQVIVKIAGPGGLNYHKKFPVSGEGGFVGSERIDVRTSLGGAGGDSIQLSGRVFVNEFGKVQYQIGCWEEKRVWVGRTYSTERRNDLFSGVLDNARHVSQPRMRRACTGVLVDVSTQPLP